MLIEWVFVSLTDKLMNPKPAIEDEDEESTASETELDKWASNVHSSASVTPRTELSPFQVFCKYRQDREEFRGLADAVGQLRLLWEVMTDADRVVSRNSNLQLQLLITITNAITKQ